MPKSGMDDISTEYIQPHNIIQAAALKFIRLFRCIACVMANHRSSVMMDRVNTDRWLAKTVRKPAALQPKPGNILNMKMLIMFNQKMVCLKSNQDNLDMNWANNVVECGKNTSEHNYSFEKTNFAPSFETRITNEYQSCWWTINFWLREITF